MLGRVYFGGQEKESREDANLLLFKEKIKRERGEGK